MTTTCRGCGAPLDLMLCDLGLSPLANSYVPLDRASETDPVYPLRVRVCRECLLAQADEAVDAADIFAADYAYHSSFSDSWLEHCGKFAAAAIGRYELGPTTLVMEIASNDGYLLQYFKNAGVPVLGVEPAAQVAAIAETKGVPTRVAFFGRRLADELANEGIRPKLICSANVLAHVPDINDFVSGVARLLGLGSVYTVEFPHLLNLIKQTQFDTIYHEHYSYLSLLAVQRIFERNGMRVFDVEELPTHGGSLRVYGCLKEAMFPVSPDVQRVLAKEREAGLDKASGYENFEPEVQRVREDLLAFLNQAKADGATVAAYGAAAKGNTLLNYCEVGVDLIAYCVDKNPTKQGKLLPGSHIPVYGVEKMLADPPDFVLILPWNIRDEVVRQMTALKGRTRFLTAIPRLELLD